MVYNLPELPKSIKDPRVKPFFEKFYEMSNDVEGHDKFPDLFTADGEYSMNDKKAKGREEIIRLRKAMFSHVPDRNHGPIEFFTHGDDQYNLMVHGDVTYKHHYGHETGSDWAAKYRLTEEGGELKLASCLIMVDSVAHV